MTIHVVLVSCPGVGHIKPLLALAEEMAKANNECMITVFGILPENQVSKVVPPASLPRVTFHYFLDPFDGMPFSPKYEENASQFVTDMIAYIDSQGLPTPACHVYDMFAGWSKLLADTYKIPSFLFMPCSLRVCALFSSLTEHGINMGKLEKEGVTESTFDRDLKLELRTIVQPATARLFYGHVSRWRSGEGVIANDVEELSPVSTMLTMNRFGLDRPYAVYNIGPVGLKAIAADAADKIDDNIEWLDTHSANSVVYVALGSWCELPVQDVCELAFALKALERPVLWAYRGTDPNAKKEMWISDRELIDEVETDGLPLHFRDSLNPALFRIVPWVDQKRVLQHPSLGMFVSHCGWNSTLEALTLMGKPIAALPIGAEQGCNAMEISGRWNIGMRLWNSKSDRKLDRDQVKATLEQTMDSETFRQNARDLQATITEAATPRGSSVTNMKKFLSDLYSQ